MNHIALSRRQWIARGLQLSLTLAGLGAVARSSSAIEPFKRPGSPRFLLSLAAYSFRDFFKHGRDRKSLASDQQIDMFDFVDYCADHGCDGAEVTSYYFPEDVTSDFLLKLKRHAFLRGVEISGTAVGNTFTLPKGPKRDQQIASVKQWIDRAQLMGAPHIRVFAGGTEGNSKDQAKKLCIEALEECAEYAGQKGIVLGIENHGGIVAEANDLIDIIRAVKSPWIGINLDTGNFHTDDPYKDLAQCAPYAVNVQFKSELTPRGGKKQESDLGRIIGILRDAHYQGYVALEYESENPWKVVPVLLKRMRDTLRASS